MEVLKVRCAPPSPLRWLVVGAAARGRGLARNLSSHQKGRRGSGLGELALQVCVGEQGSQRPSKWKQQGQDLVQSERRQRQR